MGFSTKEIVATLDEFDNKSKVLSAKEMEANLPESNKKVVDVFCSLMQNKFDDYVPTSEAMKVDVQYFLFKMQFLLKSRCEPEFNEARQKVLNLEANVIFLCGYYSDSRSAIKIFPLEIVHKILNSAVETPISLETCLTITRLRHRNVLKKRYSEELNKVEEKKFKRFV
jgi:hypothetical protein